MQASTDRRFDLNFKKGMQGSTNGRIGPKGFPGMVAPELLFLNFGKIRATD